MKNLIYNKKILFVHIPKTGGKSILNSIDQSMWKKKLYAGHDPLFVLEINNNIENTFSFCVVRNPYKRTFSHYNHFKENNNIDCSFIEFLKIIKQKKFYSKTPMIVFPQSFYVYNLKGIIGMNKIYKYEKFYEIEDDFNINFKVMNKGNYSQENYETAYKNKECVDLVKELFSIDFINFKYDWNQL
jgi:hypothetical protein